MSTWVIGDIHGELNFLNSILSKVKKQMSPTDKIITLGDVINRGSGSIGVVQRLIELKEELGDRFISLMGNHEMSFLQTLTMGVPFYEMDSFFKSLKSVGMDITFGQFFDLPDEEQEAVVKFLVEGKMVYLDENIIVTHAPIRPEVNVTQNTNNAFSVSNDGSFALDSSDNIILSTISSIPHDYSHTSNRLVIAGHKRMLTGGATLFGNNVSGLLMIDIGAGSGGGLACVNAESIIHGEPQIICANQYKVYDGHLKTPKGKDFKAKDFVVKKTETETEQGNLFQGV